MNNVGIDNISEMLSAGFSGVKMSQKLIELGVDYKGDSDGEGEMAIRRDSCLDDFYDAVEEYETYLTALRTLESAVTDPQHSESVRQWWEGRRDFYERRLQQGGDRLLLVTNTLRVKAEQQRIGCAALDVVAKSLVYRPYNRLPPNPPTEPQLEYAADDAERIRGAFVVHITISTEDHIEEKTEFNETEVALLPDNSTTILRAALQARAIDAGSRQKGHKIIMAHDPQDNPFNYKRNFSQLVKDGYLITQRGSIGYWLSNKGRRAADWLAEHP